MFKKYLLWSLVLGLFAFSCEDDRDLITVKLGDVPVISAPTAAQSFTITEATLTESFGEVKWSPADFGFTAGTTYTVEMDKAGNDFADAVGLATTTSLSAVLSNEQVNGLMISKGLPGDVFSEMQVRIVAKVSDDVTHLVSAPVTIRISPVEAEINYPKLNVPGSYQGWNPGLETTVLFSVLQNDSYEGYVFFPIDNAFYKFALGSWTTNWGDTGADGTLERDGSDIPQGAAGLYRLNANLSTLTHASVRTDWGLIGDATPTGWDADTDLVYNADTRILSVTLDLQGGKDIKFRANDAWDINLGDTGADNKMEYGGDNIRVAESGNYTVELDLTKAIYKYKLTKN